MAKVLLPPIVHPPLQLLRFRKNVSHFRFNYALVALLALFLSLIFHPFSLLFGALYFSCDSPIVLFGRAFNDRVVAAVLGLALSGVGLNVLVALLVSVVVIEVHWVFRNSEDLYVDEESIGEGRLASVAGSQLLGSFAQIG